MPAATHWPAVYRLRYLRELWHRLGLQTAGRSIAIYGAGQHTRMLLEHVRSAAVGPTVSVILDDYAAAAGEIAGIPVRAPGAVSPASVAAVLVSSDAQEGALAERAAKWAAGAGGRSAPEIIRPYADLPPGPYEKPTAFPGAWGATLVERNGHLPMNPDELVLRLPRKPVRRAGDPLPLPPGDLRAGYWSDNDEGYLRSGQKDAGAIRALAAEHGLPGSSLKRVLDWGCSTGRILRHFADLAGADGRGAELWGADICGASVNWAAEHLSPPLRFFQCTVRPPLPLPDGSIDLVYANSVFTHIRELVDAWLMELRRIIRPGGLLFATINDENAWEWCGKNPGCALARRCAGVDFSQPMPDDFVAYGAGFDPVTFWHTEGVRRRWGFAFELLHTQWDLIPYQTGVLLRRP